MIHSINEQDFLCVMQTYISNIPKERPCNSYANEDIDMYFVLLSLVFIQEIQEGSTLV